MKTLRRHSRVLLAGIQFLKSLDPRQKHAGMTEDVVIAFMYNPP